MAGTTNLDFPADLNSIAPMLAAIEGAAEDVLSPAAMFRLTMAVEELVTNAVMHGKLESAVSLAITVGEGEVQVELSDAGLPFDPFADAPKPDLDASVESRKVGGLGLHLVAAMVDRAEYRREGGRNFVRLTMRQPAESAP